MLENQIDNKVGFKGDGGDFFGIWIVNLLLSIITLGIYSAWAKVRTKRYFYGNTFIAGDHFEYHAKPIQILKGRIIASIILVIWFFSDLFSPIVNGVIMLVIATLIPWILRSSTRFNAAMTSYRNVHFSFNGSLKDAYIAILGRGALAFVGFVSYMTAMGSVNSMLGLSLGFILAPICYVWVLAGVQRYFMNGYRYGNWALTAELETSIFMKVYAKAMGIGALSTLALGLVIGVIAYSSLSDSVDAASLLQGDTSSLAHDSVFIVFGGLGYLSLFVVTMIVTAYIASRIRNYIFSQLQATLNMEDFEETTEEVKPLAFRSTLTARGYTGLVVSNFLLQLFSLGFARPWVMVRTSRYLANNTVVIGDMTQLKAKGQASDVKSAITDEVTDAFDLDLDIGLG